MPRPDSRGITIAYTRGPVSTPDLREEYRAYLQEPWRWRALIRRARGISKQDKYVLVTLADYAGKQGTEVKPGLALLAADSDSSYEQAQSAVRLARDLGLLFIAHRGNRRRRTADEYWLIMHPDALDLAAKHQIDFETPARRELRAEAERSRRRADVAASAARKQPEGRSNPQDPQTRGQEQPSDRYTPEDPSDPQNTGPEDSPHPLKPVFEGPWDPPTSPTTDLVVKNSTSPTDDALHTDLTVSRAQSREQAQDPLDSESATPTKRGRCPHGNSRRRRNDGKPRCPHCASNPQPTGASNPPPDHTVPIPVPIVTHHGRYQPARCQPHGLPAATCTLCRREARKAAA